MAEEAASTEATEEALDGSWNRVMAREINRINVGVRKRELASTMKKGGV